MNGDPPKTASVEDSQTSADTSQSEPQYEKQKTPSRNSWTTFKAVLYNYLLQNHIKRAWRYTTTQAAKKKAEITNWSRNTEPEIKWIVIGTFINGSMAFFTLAMLLLTVILALTSIWQGYIAQRALKASQDSAIISKEALDEARKSGEESTRQNNEILAEYRRIASASQQQAEGVKESITIGKVTARATEEGVQVASRTARNDQRAWVGVIAITGAKYDEGGKSVYIREGMPIILAAEAVNSGKSIALELESSLAISINPSNTPFEPLYKIREDAISSKSVLQPGMHIILNTPAYNVLPNRQEIDRLRKGTQRLYIYGKLSYLDVFKRKHFTTFCAFLHADLTAFGSCNTYNQAD